MTYETNKRAIFMGLTLLILGCGGPPLEESIVIAASNSEEWELTWETDFSGPEGTPLDPSIWTHEIGNSGWGNNQLEYNTDSGMNAFLDGQGNLRIEARKESFGGSVYTSARVTTKNALEQTYGRFEARIKLPYGQGIWPAFWLLGANIDDVGWPSCGEIDILELRGQEPHIVHGSLHGPGYSGATPFSTGYELEQGESFSDDYHVFSVEWGPERIDWYVDGDLYHVIVKDQLGDEQTWVFDHPFFIILNIAVGGNYVGSPDASTLFPQAMLVDYIRVYGRGQ